MAKTQSSLKVAIAFRKMAIDTMVDLHQLALSVTSADTSLLKMFKLQVTRLEPLRLEFDSQHDQIITLLATADKDITEETAIKTSFYNQYFEIKYHYEELVPSCAMVTSSQPVSSQIAPKLNVRLPQLEIPKFDGSFKGWLSFCELYTALIHNNQSLTDAEKFQYLQASLSGDPLHLIRSFSFSSSNYSLAYDALVKRYDNQRKLLTYYWNEIVNVNVGAKHDLQHVLNTYSENLAMLEKLNYKRDMLSDFIIFQSLLNKLDDDVRQRFERSIEDVSIVPKYDILKAFLETECQSIEFTKATTSSSKPNANNRNNRITLMSNVQSHSNFCNICKTNMHRIYSCQTLLDKTAKERYTLIKDLKLCTNCLQQHSGQKCPSIRTCMKCGAKHHSLLHFETKQEKPQSAMITDKAKAVSQGATVTSFSATHGSDTSLVTVVLSTILLEVQDVHGEFHLIRAVLDSGSQANFIREETARKCGFTCTQSPVTIKGIGDISHTPTKGVISCVIRSRIRSNFKLQVEATVLPTICGTNLPTSPIQSKMWQQFQYLQLADPEFYKPNRIDMLIGAELFPLAIRPEKLLGSQKHLSAINTEFGWTVMGKCDLQSTLKNKNVHSLFTTSSEDPEITTDQLIKRFWEIEEVSAEKTWSDQDQRCEQIFLDTHSRDCKGRYEVHLPFRTDNPTFVKSYELAHKRLMYLERRLSNDSKLHRAYSEFMQDYLQAGHMHRVSQANADIFPYYIPHHAVYNARALRPKLRVVFDASAKDATGVSLNSTLLTGHKLQLDIATLLLQFRAHKFVFCTDIRQMYRQILVHSSHHNYQRILWRFSTSDPVAEYVLNTVAYGVVSAPFLALRVIKQLAVDEKARFPLASEVLQTSVYVDDILTGAESIEEALELQKQVIAIFASAGMELRKWSANHRELLSSFPREHCEVALDLDKESKDVVKVLGLQWNPSADKFSFAVTCLERHCTKRTILSEIARVFDPLGFLAPLTFFTKHLMQLLWSLGLHWDETPPPEILEKWTKFTSELHLLTNFVIPRYVPVRNHSYQLHGFCDASERGYAAVVYLRLVANDVISIHFLAAKSRVAPLKCISVPRLELSAAYLLSSLMTFILKTYPTKPSCTYAWSDSTIALSWIRSSPHRWKSFVSNRVSIIQDKIAPNQWHHVVSANNPADVACRGLLPSQLLNCRLWWSGPNWLSMPQELWPAEITIRIGTQPQLEEKKIVLSSTISIINDENPLLILLDRFSSFPFVQRITAFMFRFIIKCRASTDEAILYKSASGHPGCLSTAELWQSTLRLVKAVQSYAFRDVYKHLRSNILLPKYLRKLHLFIDNDHVIRVGGRLFHSTLPYGQKFPMLLPKCHRLTTLLIEYTHKKYCHAGPNTVYHILSQQFWILSAKQVIRSVLLKCLTCFKHKPTPLHPLMGNLPSFRVTPQVKAFVNSGVDFAGPFLVKTSKLRTAKSIKSYVCIFICMATKAVHLELVGDLSANAFVAALRRFVARRGRCAHLFSDCGTNFVGAFRHLRKLTTFVKDAAQSSGVQWSFNPPVSPHFGGIWEAGVKSTKTHLHRVVGLQILTYEEFNTLLTQIEAILNSRPLTAQSSDPSDLAVLTPGHFLTLEPLVSIPEEPLMDEPVNRLNRWQLIQRLHQGFWYRWKSEYLHSLQQRHKWFDSGNPIELGTLVLIVENQTPPLQWRRGRIVQLHPGDDGICRVVTVDTAQGKIRRAVTKLCPLPM